MMITRRFFSLLVLSSMMGTISFGLGPPPGKGGGGGGDGGGGGGPTPTGSIYFTQAANFQVSTYRLAPDGSSIAHLSELDNLGVSDDPEFAFPYGTGFPSALQYGADNHRWWIYFKLIRVEHPTPTSSRSFYDLFATPDGVYEVRVTNFSDFNILIGNNSEPPAWATGSDAFMSFSGADIDDSVHRLYRIGVSADDLEATYNGTPTMTLPVVPTDTLRTEILVDAPTLYAGNFRHHAWSPDGSQVVFVMEDPDVTASRESLWRLDLDTSVMELILEDNSSSPHIRWSPDGSLIALADLGDILVMDPNVPNSWIVAANGSIGVPNTNPLWSPDGSHIAFIQQSYNKRARTNQFKIYSVSLLDSSVQEIGQNTDSLTYKRLLEWTAE